MSCTCLHKRTFSSKAEGTADSVTAEGPSVSSSGTRKAGSSAFASTACAAGPGDPDCPPSTVTAASGAAHCGGGNS